LAVLSMARQLGTALGIAVLVAIVGASAGSPSLAAFRHGWLFILTVAVLDGLALQFLPAYARAELAEEAHAEQRDAAAQSRTVEPFADERLPAA
jgi:hypothetical protein